MARGENPGVVLSIQTTLTYDKDEDFGHASAGKDLCLSIHNAGSDIGKGKLAGDNERILGKFLDLDKDGVASYMATGIPMILRKTAAEIVPGSKVVGAGADTGKVKQAPATAAGNTAGRGYVTKIQEAGDNGRINVVLPA